MEHKLWQISVTEAMPVKRPEQNHFDFENKVDFLLLHKVTLRSSSCFAVEKPLSTNSRVTPESQSHTERRQM